MKGNTVKILLILLFCLVNQTTWAQLPWGVKRITADEYYMMVTQKIKEKDYRTAIKLSYEGLDRMPDYIDLHFMQGRAFMLNGQADSARIKFKFVNTKSPRYRDAYIVGTNLEMELKNKEEALCIINDGLYYFPYEREFMTKKLEVLDFIGDYKSAEKYAEELISIHYHDSIALRYYLGYKSEAALRYLKYGNYIKASECYESMSALDPSNREAIDGIYNIQLKQGKTEDNLAYLNAELAKNPKSYEHLTKKAFLLSENYRYAEALQTTTVLVGYYPGDARAQTLHYETQMACGRYYMNEDPYLVFQGVLEKKPRDKEALNYTINMATARGLHQDALLWENKALKEYPNDREFLEKKVGTCETLKRYGEAAYTADRLVRISPGNNTYRQQAADFHMLSGRQNMKENELDSALANYNKVLFYQPNNYLAVGYAAEIYVEKGKYDEALALLDAGLDKNPDEENLMLRRTAVLEKAKLYEEATLQAEKLHELRPSNKKYTALLVDEKTLFAKDLLQNGDYDGAREQYRDILKLDPTNMDALNGMVNLESGTNRYDSALHYVNIALEPNPFDRELLLKKSSILEAQKKYPEAYAITGELHNRYPYNSKIKQAYVEQLVASGREYNKQEKYDSALIEFNKALTVSPRDSNALNYSINVLLQKNETDSALQTVNRALKYYPNNENFTFKKAIVLEQAKAYHQASATADTLVLINPSLFNIDFADQLKARTLRNELGLMFLYTTFDSGGTVTRANIATIQYMRYTRWGSVGGRLNMAGRSIGTGLQLEGDLNYIHSKKFTSYLNFGISNAIVFPRIKAGYTLYYNYKTTYTHEIGLRYLQFDDNDLKTYSLVLGTTRYWNDFWGTIRYYGTIAFDNLYHAVLLSTRTYITPGTEYVFAAVGAGTSPDEYSRNFAFTENLGVATYNFSIGYTRIVKHRNTFGVNGTWYNQRLNSGFYRNQYDLFFMFLRKF